MSRAHRHALKKVIQTHIEDLALKENTSYWNILKEAAIDELVKFVPTEVSNLKQEMEGWGMTKIKKFGAGVLEVINKYIEEHSVTFECTFDQILKHTRSSTKDDDTAGLGDSGGEDQVCSRRLSAVEGWVLWCSDS